MSLSLEFSLKLFSLFFKLLNEYNLFVFFFINFLFGVHFIKLITMIIFVVSFCYAFLRLALSPFFPFNPFLSSRVSTIFVILG